MSDLAIKTIKGIYKTKPPIEKYKIHGKEFRNDLKGICIL